MKFAILILVLLPPALALSAWVSMKIKLIPPRREATEEEKEELRKSLGLLVCYFRALCLEIEKQKGK